MFGSSKTRRLNVVPRNDRFFLGSRYGKRAGEYMSPYEQDLMSSIAADSSSANNDNLQNMSQKGESSNAPFMMSCIYTGLKNYYRCNSM